MNQRNETKQILAFIGFVFLFGVVFVFCSSPDNETDSAQVTVESPSVPLSKMNQLLLPGKEKQEDARKLLKPLGIAFDSLYTYSDFLRIKEKHGIGTGNDFEAMKCSIAHDGSDPNAVWDAMAKASQDYSHWEQFYYKGINQTWIVNITNNDANSWVRLVKVASGRDPDLNIH